MKQLDKLQEKAANILQNAVVSAGAGSGKTTVLSARAVNLVKRGLKIDEILVLTFTKKATVEMKERIFAALKEAADGGNENAKNAIRSFNLAHIQTLDSYCAEIAKQGAHFYGISPSFSQDKTKAEDAIKNRALPFLLKNRDSQAIQSLSRIMDFDRIAQEFFVDTMINYSTVANPIDFLKDCEKQATALSLAWQKHKEDAESSIILIQKLFNEGGFKMTSNFAKNVENALNSFDFPENNLTEDDVKNAKTDEIDDYIKSLGVFLEIKMPGGSMSGVLLEIKEEIKTLKTKIETLLLIESGVANFKIAQESANLLWQFQDEVNREKRISGILTFKDVSDLALKTLKEHAEIRALEKRKFRAIMIDEFQDNNEQQRELLFLLAEKRQFSSQEIPTKDEIDEEKLFFVGDEKQSIYRFRGADVSVFRNLKDTFKKEDGSGNLDLATNYRSEPELIAAFNTIFGGIPYPLATENKNLPSVFLNQDETPQFEAKYSKVQIPTEKLANANWEKRRVHVQLFLDEKTNDDDFLSATENEAAHVAKKIREMIDGGKKASEIAILLKTTTHQNVFERMLLLQGVPYSTEIFKGFFRDWNRWKSNCKYL